MKIIITESKLYQAVIDYLYETYDVDNIHWTYATDDWGNEIDGVLFYLGDFDDDENLFRWYDKGYWESDDMSNDDMSNQDKERFDKWIEDSPILSFDENWQEECSNGIHFFINRLEAEGY